MIVRVSSSPSRTINNLALLIGGFSSGCSSAFYPTSEFRLFVVVISHDGILECARSIKGSVANNGLGVMVVKVRYGKRSWRQEERGTVKLFSR